MNITASLQIKNNIYLASFYGLRRSEVLGLRWDAFNFEDKTITIKHKAIETRKDNKRVILLKDKTKNQSSYRTLPLVDDIIVLPQIFNYWLGYCDSNTGMSESESDALPLGDTPIYFNKILLHTELQYQQIYNILILSQSKKKVHTFCVFP